MEFETLLYEKRDRVAVITLNRPERLNAINSAMSRELPQAWQQVKKDPEVVVAVPSDSTSQLPSHVSGSGETIRETWAAVRIASNMFWLSEHDEPSVPMPTPSPRSTIRRAGAMPAPSRRLLPGLCATDAPRSRMISMSSSSSHIQWAPVKWGPRRPSPSRWRTSDVP